MALSSVEYISGLIELVVHTNHLPFSIFMNESNDDYTNIVCTLYNKYNKSLVESCTLRDGACLNKNVKNTVALVRWQYSTQPYILICRNIRKETPHSYSFYDRMLCLNALLIHDLSWTTRTGESHDTRWIQQIKVEDLLRRKSAVV